MINSNLFKASIARSIEAELPANPLNLKNGVSGLGSMSNYSQVLLKHDDDKDCNEILEKVRILNVNAPKKINIPHSYCTEEINGERIYNQDGTLAIIREYENDIIREYYPKGELIEKILERDKNSGNVLAKIEPAAKNGSLNKSNITIFDTKINNKYTMYQVEGDGLISSITEFSASGKAFRTLFRNPDTTSPVRYIEADENENADFALTDCKFDYTGEITEIKKTSSTKEVLITYGAQQKNISVKSIS